MFRLRTDVDGEITGADVLCYCPVEAALLLMKEIGGSYREHLLRWTLPAKDQEQGLSRLLPYIRLASVRQRMNRVLMYRRTQVGKVSEKVKAFRRGLVDYR